MTYVQIHSKTSISKATRYSVLARQLNTFRRLFRESRAHIAVPRAAVGVMSRWTADGQRCALGAVVRSRAYGGAYCHVEAGGRAVPRCE
jgi:hypothetical protein